MATNTASIDKPEDKMKTGGNDVVQSFEKKVTDLYQKGQDTVTESVGKVVPALQSTYQQAEQKIAESVDAAESTIKKYPLQTLAIGLGAGFLLGALAFSFRKTE